MAYVEISAHFDVSLWPDVEDPATQHPMSARIVQMLDTYRKLYQETGRPQPKMKLASFLSSKEAIAAAEFGCHSATLSPKILDELATLPYDASGTTTTTTQPPGGRGPKPDPAVEYYQQAGPTPTRLRTLASIDPLAAADWDGHMASTEEDYLVQGGAALDRAVDNDPLAKTRLRIALEAFTDAENKSKQKIEEILAAL